MTQSPRPADHAGPTQEQIQATIDKFENTGRHLRPGYALVIGVIAAAWSLFQLFIASPLAIPSGFDGVGGVPARAIHLAFGLLLAFLLFPGTKKSFQDKVPLYDIAVALTAAGSALYIYVNYDGISSRNGILLDIGGIPVEAIIGGLGLFLLLEATRRSIGVPLVIVAGVFLVFSVFGQYMPDVVAHKGVSVERLIGYHWLTGEAIFGIPIDVSVSFVFLFVLFGALLERAGAGRYFLDLAFAMVGKYRGGPAKAAIMASGMTGAISGSSIANVVTTGTFTIPVMKKTGFPGTKAGAIEVAASTNGQIMPPIMGAAAFIIAELIGVSYFEVVVHALIPAVISYFALFYISHLEACKLGLKGLQANDYPPEIRGKALIAIFLSGLHFLIPIVILIYLLMVERQTAGAAVFWSILSLMGIIVYQEVRTARRLAAGAKAGLHHAVKEIYGGLIAGARNMVGISVAVATAGIIVGAVSSTGLNNAMVGVVEALSGGNVYILLILTAVLALVLGMGLPTTANYLVVASLLAGVLVELGSAAGLELPLIAVHLFVFYFGLMADSTPPVCLAAFAASAISGDDPLKTGVQSFLYDIRTAILPFVFIFNTELLLIGVESWLHGLTVFAVSLLAIFCFSSVTQGWLLVKVRWFEAVLLLVAMFTLFRPDYVMNKISPAFEPIPVAAFVSGGFEVQPDQKVRLHVTRQTDYGERFRLYVLRAPETTSETKGMEAYGLSLVPIEGSNHYEVVDLIGFGGLAETAGASWGDIVTSVDVEQPDQPAKEWIYLIGLALIAATLALQWGRFKEWRARQS